MMNREILLKALAEKKAIRSQNEETEARRLKEVCLASMDIARLIEERRQGLFLGLRSALNGIVPQNIEEDTQHRNERITTLLKELGYGEDYLSPIFSCPTCEDTGYTGESKKVLCSCAMKLYQKILSGDCFSGEVQTFENFSEAIIPSTKNAGEKTSQRARTKAIRDICERYADALPNGPILNLLLYGKSGLGKTYMLRSIGVRASQRGVSTLSLSANSLLNHIRAHYFARSNDTPDNSFMTIPLLLVDDLGTEPLWEGITVEQLFSLIEYRLNHKLHTVMSTNLNWIELKERYSERFVSRFQDKRHCIDLEFSGEDLRKNMR